MLRKDFKRRVVIATILLAVICFGACGKASSGDSYESGVWHKHLEYEIQDGQVIITGLSENESNIENIEIPSKIKGYPVTSIGFASSN